MAKFNLTVAAKICMDHEGDSLANAYIGLPIRHRLENVRTWRFGCTWKEYACRANARSLRFLKKGLLEIIEYLSQI